VAEGELEFAFEVRLTLGTRYRISPTQSGDRGFVGVVSGEFEGPDIRGTALPAGGGDWPRVRQDGTLELNAHYMLQTHDGVMIYIHNRGIRHGPPEVIARLYAGEAVDPSEYYFRVSPTFEVENGPYDWLTKYLFIGYGDRRTGGNVIRYYKVL
jgi:hypothetical protein